MSWKVTRWEVTDQPELRDSQASVTHWEGDDGTHRILIDALRAVVVPDGKAWLVHGLEIDYAASADSPEDAKARFAEGLGRSMVAHVERYGSPARLLKIAPQEVWDLFFQGMRQIESSHPEQDETPRAAQMLARFVPSLTFMEQGT